MITVSIAINGIVIYARTAVNKGPLRTGKRCTYELDDGSKLAHSPDDGAIDLAHAMLDTINEVKATPEKAYATIRLGPQPCTRCGKPVHGGTMHMVCLPEEPR